VSGTPRSFEFRLGREAGWVELERLVGVVEKRGVRALDGAELARLPILYRSALSSLSVARAISLDQDLIDYLETLSSRAYVVVYGTRRFLRDAVRDFVRVGFPSAVRGALRPIAIAALCLTIGAVIGFVVVHRDADRYYGIMPTAMAGDRTPASSTEDLRAVLYDDGGPAEALATFASFLFSNNARIGILAFAVGFLFGVPVFALMLYNGLILGAMAALYHGRGLSMELWAWLLPHGVTELGAVALCGGAGLVLAHAIVFPGRHGRLESLAARGREAGTIALGAVCMLFVAALIEGIFRQTVHDVVIRYAVAGTTLVAWTAYFALAGRRARGAMS
jgi:uncharacterized membrane protein SpoIIM required for sporulation